MIFKGEAARSILKLLESAKIKPYPDEERIEVERKLEEILAMRDQKKRRGRHMTLKECARVAFAEVNKSKSRNKFKIFVDEFNKLVEESKSNNNNVGCAVSIDCSITGCYRYSVCDFKDKW